jgi:hypothetical protein
MRKRGRERDEAERVETERAREIEDHDRVRSEREMTERERWQPRSRPSGASRAR